MLPIVAAIALSTAAGIAAARRWPERSGSASRRSLLIVLYVVMPPTVFFNLAAVDFDANLGIGIGLGLLATAIAAGAAYLIGGRLLGLSRPEVGSMMACTLVANTGYLGYPLTAAVLGLDELGEAVAYDIAVGGPGLLVGAFAVGAALGTEAGSGARERTGSFFARNVPLYAGVLALFAPDALAPDVLVDIARIVVVAILPIGFFAVGVALAEEADDGVVPLPPRFTRSTAGVVATKLVLLPAILLALAVPLIDLPPAYLLMAAMPSGLNAMIVTHAYGLDLSTTAEAISWTTAIVIAVATVASLL